jgi:hypothetical protein
MLLIDIVNNFFPAHKDARIFQKEFLLNVQNAYATVMLAYLMTQLYHCAFYDDCDILITTPQNFIYYFVNDMLLCEPGLYVHHITSFVMAYIYSRNIEIMKQSYHLTFGLGIIEISTVFLTIRAILRKYKRDHPYITLVYNVNDKIFVVTFFYTRVYLFLPLFFNEHVNQLIMQFSSVEYCIFKMCLCLLYLINLYWAYQIIQVFVKPFFARIGA